VKEAIAGSAIANFPSLQVGREWRIAAIELEQFLKVRGHGFTGCVRTGPRMTAGCGARCGHRSSITKDQVKEQRTQEQKSD
jgi:hypothetical protein